MKQIYLKQKWKLLVWGLILIPIKLVVLFLLISYIKQVITNFSFKVNLWNLIQLNINNWKIIIITFIGSITIYSFYVYLVLFNNKKHHSKLVSTSQTDFGTAKWLDTKAFNFKYPIFDFTKHNSIHGFVVAGNQTKNNVIVNVRNNTHALVTGGTGSGKTQGLVIPTIQTNAYSITKPGMVITDPKGELYATQSLLLQQQGYDVKVINLRNTTESVSWNPLQLIYNWWLQALTIEFTNTQHPELINSQKILLKAKAQEELRDLCKTLFPLKSKDIFWDLSAGNLIKAIILGMLEDMEQIVTSNNCVSLEQVNELLEKEFPLKKFNLATVAIIATQKDEMKLWFKSRKFDSPAKIAANIILNNADATLGSILASVSAGMELFADPGIQMLVSENDIDLTTIMEQPTAIFIIIPDERINRHIFASLFISQLYKSLIEKTNQLPNNHLIRPVYFLCDEFGNIPVIANMEAIITVSRSRWIYFMLIIQDLKQLESKYGREGANIIFANCSMHIYLQTMDLQTAKTYSEIIGNQTVLQINYSRSNGKNSNQSEQLRGHRLISADDLMKLPANEAVIIFSKENAVKSKLLPWWQNQNYVKGMIKKVTKTRKTLNFFNDLYYDISNSYFYQQSNNNKQASLKPNSYDNNDRQTLMTMEMELKQLQLQLKEFATNKKLTIIEEVAKDNIVNKINNLNKKLKK